MSATNTSAYHMRGYVKNSPRHSNQGERLAQKVGCRAASMYFRFCGYVKMLPLKIYFGAEIWKRRPGKPPPNRGTQQKLHTLHTKIHMHYIAPKGGGK
ncbi:MAG: hypothetical protein Q6366_015530 [Candidatus Freyarchaeota archaeon]